MASLTGQTIAGSYKDLLQVSNSNSGVDATLRTVEDGEGTSSSLKLSDRQAEVLPAADGTAVFDVSKNDGTSILSVDTTNSKVIATELDISGNVDIDGTTTVGVNDATASSLGIGITASIQENTTRLDIGSSNTAVSKITLKDNDATDGWYVESNLNFAIGYNTTDTINITQAGLHGINTTSPSEALTVSGNIDLQNSSGFAKIDNSGTLSMADDASVLISDTRNGSQLIMVYDQSSGDGAVFFTSFTTAVAKLSGSGTYAVSDTDGKICVVRNLSGSGNNHDVSVVNRLGSTRNIAITVLASNSY